MEWVVYVEKRGMMKEHYYKDILCRTIVEKCIRYYVWIVYIKWALWRRGSVLGS